MISRFLIQYRYCFFIAVALLTLTILIVQPTKNENQTIDSMFAMDDDLHASYQSLKRVFGGNEIVLLVYHDPELMTDEGFKRQLRLCNNLNQITGIRGESIGIATLVDMIRSYDVDRFSTFLKWTGFDLSTSKLIDSATNLLTGFTQSDDQKTAAVILMLQSKEESGIPRGQIVESIRQVVATTRRDLNFSSEILMVGEPVMVADGFRMVKADGRRLGMVATIALSLVVLVAFRSIRWTLIPAAVVQFSLLASDAAVSVMDIQVTIVGSMSTSIITVIAVSTTIHLIIRIRRNMNQGDTYQEATLSGIRQLAVPISFACLTDAVGFGALWFAELEPVKDFATVMVVGSLLVMFAYWTIVPTLALIPWGSQLPFWDLKTERTGLHKAFSAGLNLPIQFSRRYPTLVIGGAIAILIFSLLGIRQNTIESDFTKNFRSDSEIVASYRFVEENLGGAGVWDIMIRVDNGLDKEFLKRIKQLQDRLRAEVIVVPAENQAGEKSGDEKVLGLTKVLSLVDAIEAFSGKPVGKLAPSHLNFGISLAKTKMPAFFQSLYSSDPDQPETEYYRVMLRSRERTTSEQKKSVINQVNQICQEVFPPTTEEPQYLTTGFYVLLTYMIDSVIRDQWTTFGAAACGIVLMLVISLRDFRLALIGLFPNLLPIFLLLGMFGWLAMPINLGIALIAAVAIGLSIDSSIHYIYDFQQHRRVEQLSVLRSLELAQDQVGRALVYSTFALVIGFSSLCLSEFLPTVYFGATAMIAMVGGLIGNLFLLPLLISTIYPPES